MEIPLRAFPPAWQILWDAWNLRGFIILSLSLQTILFLLAPLRKRTSSGFVIMPLWSAYLVAGWVAGFAVGLISNSEGTASEGPINNDDLLAFWAPFLLGHLGARDTITAFAVEDNELWLRHLLNLIIHCLATAYVLVQSMPNKLLAPTLLMLLTGVIKYGERVRALYLASEDRFRDSMLTEPDPGPNYPKLMDAYFSKKEANLPTRIVMIPEPNRTTKAVNAVKEGNLTHLEVVLHAYRFFETFKGLIVDLIFSFRERRESRDFFLKRNAKDAFSVVEVELNFIYEVLYTKASVVHCLAGHIFRTISFLSIVAALALFSSVSKMGLDTSNVSLTYVLLYGAIAFDIIALLKLLFSDWTAIHLKKYSPHQLKSEDKSYSTKYLNFMLAAKSQRWSKDSMNPFLRCLGSPMNVLSRRWCESVSQFNLIYYCLHQRSKGKEIFIGYLGLTDFLDELTYVKNEPFTAGLRDFIYEELLMKSRMADDLDTAKEICAARGDWVLRVEACGSLLDYIENVDYDESLLLWHIATELCYNDDKNANVNTGEGHNGNFTYRAYAKILSDYMSYLLAFKPTMMSAVAGIGEIRFRDTSAEAIKFFRVAKPGGGQNKIDPDQKQLQACNSILNVHTAVNPVTIKGDRSKSVLFDACILAKKLRELREKDKWVIMSRVWVELLSHAACHCRAYAHAKQLSKGGQLLTLVWLLMANFGLGYQFQISGSHARAKLIVGK